MEEASGDHSGQSNSDSDTFLKKAIGDYETDQVMHDVEHRKIDSVTENKPLGRLMDESHIDQLLNPEVPEKLGVSHTSKDSLKGLLEEADMEVTLKGIEKSHDDEE